MPVRFASRLMLVLCLVGVVPVLLFGALSFHSNRRELHRVVGGLQTQAALDFARSCHQLVLSGVDNLRPASRYLPLEGLSPEQLSQVLDIPLRQLSAFNLLVLVDERGHALAPAVYSPDEDERPQRVTEESLALFSSRRPCGPRSPRARRSARRTSPPSPPAAAWRSRCAWARTPRACCSRSCRSPSWASAWRSSPRAVDAPSSWTPTASR
ncbi:hypothetical protein ACN28S_15465 [Cystobacter fuscus]